MTKLFYNYLEVTKYYFKIDKKIQEPVRKWPNIN